jgi:predicted dienelactone hydrolase
MQSSPFTVRRIVILVALLVVGPTQLGLSQELLYNAKSGKYAVETISFDWHDKARDRDVPVKLHYPKTGAGPFPVIIFSHGLGGSRDGYEYLGRHWASHGYVSVHLQHKGSDTAVAMSAPLVGDR